MIAKHLKARSEAIRTAVNSFNKAARELSPPREPININTVLSYAFLSEFDLLRETRQDIRETKAWARPAIRTLVDKWYRLKHAKEEIKRLNVEIRRVRDWMKTDIAHQESTITELRDLAARHPENKSHEQGQWIAMELEHRLAYRKAANKKIATNLGEAENLRGFTGQRIVPEGTLAAESSQSQGPDGTTGAGRSHRRRDGNDSDSDDDLNEQAERLNSLLNTLE